ncbi:MAG TPA: hypothetical protein VN721_03570 [Flavipsychrobacter sp.]|nr:hypothetical protein [Flavipsychrobacter sp.]
MKKLGLLALIPALVLAVASCKKSSNGTTNVAAAQIQVGQAISDTTTGGPLKGTFGSGKTYNIKRDIVVNFGDTLLIQSGVTLKMSSGVNIIVHGKFVSLGTSSAPVSITTGATKTTGSSSPSSDPAYAGGWGGIYCDTSCNLLVLKWTHLDFGGAVLIPQPFNGPTAGSSDYVVWFGCPNGDFIMEDSWVYGCPDDVIRFYGGRINMMRNTFEKFGGTGGDGFNSKSGTQGNMAYNMFIGGATNGTKCSDDGNINPQNMIAMYNNTYVNCGFRNNGTFGARAGCAEVENDSRALVYNNIIVNCLTGYRIAGGPKGSKVYLADTSAHSDGPITQTKYGYNLMYGDDSTITDQFVPTSIAQAEATQPQSTDIPNMKAFLGLSYNIGDTYSGASLVGQNNPEFKNYPLPNKNYVGQASIDAYDFHLAPGSPAIGKGYKGFSAITTCTIGSIPVDPNFGSSGITGPGSDLGCYQTDGSGNQH